MRNITVNGQLWRYKIGKSFLVARQPETKQKLLISLPRLLGYDQYSYEKDVHKGSYYVQVTPKLVADYIKEPVWYATAELIDILKFREKQLMPKSIPIKTEYWCGCCRDWHN